MKNIIFALSLCISVQASAKHLVSGSDTLGGVMTDAIIAAGLDSVIGYTGGGSGVGEKAMLNSEIGMTAMSRQLKPEIVEGLKAQNVVAVEHVVALDGLGIFVNAANPTAQMDFGTLLKVFACEITTWQQVPGSNKSGPIKAFRRDDKSGTTDTFKHLVGIKKFGDCVTVVAETADIAENTALNADAIGYAGASATKEGNKTLAIAKAAGAPAVRLTTQTVRDFSYPLARALFVYEVSGARQPNEAEKQLLEAVTDRSFLDPIVQDHDFVTID